MATSSASEPSPPGTPSRPLGLVDELHVLLGPGVIGSAPRSSERRDSRLSRLGTSSDPSRRTWPCVVREHLPHDTVPSGRWVRVLSPDDAHDALDGVGFASLPGGGDLGALQGSDGGPAADLHLDPELSHGAGGKRGGAIHERPRNPVDAMACHPGVVEPGDGLTTDPKAPLMPSGMLDCRAGSRASGPGGLAGTPGVSCAFHWPGTSRHCRPVTRRRTRSPDPARTCAGSMVAAYMALLRYCDSAAPSGACVWATRLNSAVATSGTAWPPAQRTGATRCVSCQGN